MKHPNIGKNGAESIRINGMKIEALPLGQGHQAKEGLQEFLKTERETKRNNITAKFPKHKVEFLKAKVTECRRNIKRIRGFKSQQKELITEYRQHIRDCDQRERELSQLCADNPDDAAKMKELRLKYPPYDVDALQAQIEQFEEAIERCDSVIEQEYESISEIEGLLALVEQREKELKSV
jgi:uncharacterized coiled-coil DUF342 family protein